jgi:hypothetical protein
LEIPIKSAHSAGQGGFGMIQNALTAHHVQRNWFVIMQKRCAAQYMNETGR